MDNTCEARTSTIVELTRSAMNRWRSGGSPCPRYRAGTSLEVCSTPAELRAYRRTRRQRPAAASRQEVIADAEAFKSIVAEQLDISPYAFSNVIDTLERAGMIDDVQRRGRRVSSFTERVPYYDNLYSALSDTWRDGHPRQLEQVLIGVPVIDGEVRSSPSYGRCIN